MDRQLQARLPCSLSLTQSGARAQSGGSLRPHCQHVLPSEAGSLLAVQGGRGQPSRAPLCPHPLTAWPWAAGAAHCRLPPEPRRGRHRKVISSLSHDPRPRLSWRRGEGASFIPDGRQKPLGQGRRGPAGFPPRRWGKGTRVPASGHLSTAEAPSTRPASRLMSGWCPLLFASLSEPRGSRPPSPQRRKPGSRIRSGSAVRTLRLGGVRVRALLG